MCELKYLIKHSNELDFNSGSNNGVLKRSKRRGVGANGGGTGSGISGTSGVSSGSGTEKSAADKNGGTWPKARIGPLIQNGTGTILHPRKTKERLPLSVLLSNPPKYESTYNYNRISNPIPLASFSGVGVSSSSSNRHTVYKAVESPLPSFTKSAQLHSGQKSFVPSAVQFKEFGLEKPAGAGGDGSGGGGLGSALAPSETSIDFPLSKSSGREIEYYAKSKRATATSTPTGTSSKYTPLGHDSSQVDSLSHNRMHSQLYSGPGASIGVPRTVGGPGNFSFPPYAHSHPHHPHQQQQSIANSSHRYPSPPSLPSAQSGESIGLPEPRSFCFEPPYSPQPPPSFGHLHTPSVDLHFHKPRAHPTMSSYDVPPYVHGASGGYEGGTFPRKKENQRFRIPSNPSVTSKSSIGKLSSGSIEKTSERGSPMPSFHVEILSPGADSNTSSGGPRPGGNKRASMPDYCYAQPRPSHGQVRRIHIDKSQEPLGIQISCLKSGGVFVSSVTEHSLASQIGLQIGDQLLDVCGINMRTCGSYQVAANILRQCGNSFTMLVQYSPDSKYLMCSCSLRMVRVCFVRVKICDFVFWIGLTEALPVFTWNYIN